MKRIFILLSFFATLSCFCQQNDNEGVRILFHGVVMDAKTFSPIANSNKEAKYSEKKVEFNHIAESSLLSGFER